MFRRSETPVWCSDSCHDPDVLIDGEFVFSAPRDLILCLVQPVPPAEPKLDLSQVKSDLDPASKPIYNQNLTLVILNSHMPLVPKSEPTFIDSPTNIETPFNIDPTSLAQIKVKILDDKCFLCLEQRLTPVFSRAGTLQKSRQIPREAPGLNVRKK